MSFGILTLLQVPEPDASVTHHVQPVGVLIEAVDDQFTLGVRARLRSPGDGVQHRRPEGIERWLFTQELGELLVGHPPMVPALTRAASRYPPVEGKVPS